MKKKPTQQYFDVDYKKTPDTKKKEKKINKKYIRKINKLC